jgi:hypothetical protein
VPIQQVDGVDAEALERAVHGLADGFGVAGEADLPALGVEAEPELGGDDHLVAVGGEGLTDELLVHERAVDLGGVEEGDARAAAARITAMPCWRSTAGPRPELMPMQPSPIAETSTPLFPSLRCSIPSFLACWFRRGDDGLPLDHPRWTLWS